MSDIRMLPAVSDRVETGPVQFGNDWPGVFIRGDNAGYYSLTLGNVIERHKDNIDEMTLGVLRSLQADLSGCVLGPAGEMLRNRP